MVWSSELTPTGVILTPQFLQCTCSACTEPQSPLTAGVLETLGFPDAALVLSEPYVESFWYKTGNKQKL